jgi:hypothetical protein
MTDYTEQVETVTKVRRAASRIEDPCLSVGSHSAAAIAVVFITVVYSTIHAVFLVTMRCVADSKPCYCDDAT